MVYGKVPPQAKDIEEAVLGACLLEKDAYDKVAPILKPESFYMDAHQRIFRSFQNLSSNNLPIDMLMVAEALKATEELDLIGGPYFLVKLTNAVASSANIEAHSFIIKQKFILRELIRISGEIISGAYEDSTDVFNLMEDAEASLNGLILGTISKAYTTLDKSISDVIQRTLNLRERKDNTGIVGVPTGMKQLDDITGGWRQTDLIIVGARPSVGKSAFAANLAFNAATNQDAPTPVGIFSLEMGTEQWAARYLSAESKINSWKISRGFVSDDEVKVLDFTAYNKLANLKIYIDDTPGIDVFELKAKARRMVNKEKVGLIIIDYLQLMNGLRGKNESREQEISTISRNLKGLAKELNIPVIALSQLSRGVEKVNREPMLSDLRESGAIEQDADVVIFLIPPEEETIKQDADLKDSLLLKISKHRSGPLDKIRVRFVKEIQKTMSEEEYRQYHTFISAGYLPGNMKKVVHDDNDEELPF